MEAKTLKGMWKAIVFLTTVAAVLFSCSACEPEEVPVVYEPSLTLTVENVTEQSATLIAEAQAGNQNATVIFEYFKDNQWQQLTGGSVSGTAKTTVKQDLTSLNPETTYKVRGYLRNANGDRIAASAEVSFVSTKTTTTIEVSVKEVSRNQVILAAKAKGRSVQEELGVWFEYFDGTSWKSILAKNISGTALQEVEQKIDSLTADTNYKVRAYLLSPAKTKLVLSQEVQFQTLKGAVLTYTSAAIDLTSINLKLELTPYTDTKVLITYQGKGMGSKTITSPVYSSDKLIPLEFKLENLEKGTAYTVSIKTDEPNSTPIELSLETYAVSDYDGNLYHLVTIGTQTFIKENLKTTHFLNGDPIPNITNDDQWITLTTPAYCYYNNDPEMGKKYGALYNWYVASDPRGLITGFHAPTLEEWKKFSAYLIKNELEVKSATPDWKQPNLLWGKPSGFEVLPAGIRGGNNGEGVNNGKFQAFGEAALFWASSIEPALPQAADSPACYYGTPNISVGGLNSRWKGQSIRLVKN